MDWLIHLDERAFLALNGLGGAGTQAFFGAVTWLGHGAVQAALVLVPMALLDRRRLKAHAIAMILSVALGALAVEGLKWAVDRDRPARHFAAQVERGEVEVRMPGDALYDRSFPSGHAQAAFGTATYVALLYPALAVPALLAALLVALSRVVLGLHFPLDGLAGAAVGVLFSLAGFTLRARGAARRACATSTPG